MAWHHDKYTHLKVLVPCPTVKVCPHSADSNMDSAANKGVPILQPLSLDSTVHV